MEYKGRSTRLRWAMLSVVIAGISVFSISLVGRTEAGPTQQQDVIRLEHRMTQLDQRLFTIENSLRNLEQQSRMSGVGSRGIRPEDLIQLQTELQTLQRRLSDHECALAKLDERTLSPAMRASRRKSDPTDRCRANADTPLRLIN